MGILDFFRKPKKLQAVSGKLVPIKPGKWVKTPRGVGIVVAVSTYLQVDLVKQDGTTYDTATFNFGDISVATVLDIPECRRPVNDITARHLGYL